MSEYRNRISTSKDGANLLPLGIYMSLAGPNRESDLKRKVYTIKTEKNIATKQPNRPDFSDLGIGREE